MVRCGLATGLRPRLPHSLHRHLNSNLCVSLWSLSNLLIQSLFGGSDVFSRVLVPGISRGTALV